MLHKHHLRAESAGGDVTGVLDDLLGLHATVARSPYLQLWARIRAFTPHQLDALLDDGRAAKVACMRRTLFIESAELVPLVFAATRSLSFRGRGRFLAARGLTPDRYEHVAARIKAALEGRALDARQLRDFVAVREPLPPVIIVMCDEGRLARWKGTGGWQSGRPTYRRFEEALPTVRLDAWDEGAARRELIARYVRRYGPVRERDIAWWTGLGKAAVSEAVASLPCLVHAAVEGLEGAFLIHEAEVSDGQRPAVPPTREVALLPVLDPYLQGYRDRERCLEPRHHPFVVDRGGNVTSVILVDGRVAGVWDLVTKPSPELRLLFFDSPGASARRRLGALAAELAGFLAGAAIPVAEFTHMQPLASGSPGRFLSPLRDIE
jgi:hypothetical protein